MSEAKHTPTPWRAGYADEQDRRQRAFVRAEAVDGQPYVAICPAPIVGSHEANAELIARAVNSHADLLAACEEALSTMYSPASGTSLKLRAAIARAKGETP